MPNKKVHKKRAHVRTQKLETDFRRAIRAAKAAGSLYMDRRGPLAATGVIAIELTEIFDAAAKLGSALSLHMPPHGLATVVPATPGPMPSPLPFTGKPCGCVPGGPANNPFEKLDNSNCPTHKDEE